MYYTAFKIPFAIVISSQKLIKHKKLSIMCSSFGKIVNEFDAPLSEDIIFHIPLGLFTMNMLPKPRSELLAQSDKVTFCLKSKRLMELISK